MWLINTATLELELFHDCPADNFAILSHTWGTIAEEPTFQEFRSGKSISKPGYGKIQSCCRLARGQDIEWAWVDTCCINKESSAELSEAINSMFRWYSQSKICYAYLADVTDIDHLRQSRWFTRGWTLQELIAPKTITFFTNDWNDIGSKESLADVIHSVTGIDKEVLTLRKSFLDCPLAQRMSWASCRRTTRLEDGAYCLIGLFDVNISLQYGEGAKAFQRLQEEIITYSNDETIFAWAGLPDQHNGLLAPSAEHFVEAGSIERGQNYHERPHYFKTNKGFHIECQLLPCEMNTYVVPLDCYMPLHPGDIPSQAVIYLARTTNDHQYRRVTYHGNAVDFLPTYSSNMYLHTDRYLFSSMLSKAKTRAVFVPVQGREVEMAPNKGPPLIRVRSEYEAWRLDRSFKKVKRKNSRVRLNESVILPSLLCSGTVLSEKEDNVIRAGGRHIETSTATPSVKPTTTTAAATLHFTMEDLENGIVIGLRDRGISSFRFFGYLQIGFDQEFRPVCNMDLQNFKIGRSESSLWDLFIVNISGRHIDYFPKLWSMEKHLVESDTGLGRKARFRVGRFEGFELRLGRPLFASSCFMLKVAFQPVGAEAGLEWTLDVTTTRRHTRALIGTNLCIECLIEYLSYVVHMLLFIPALLCYYYMGVPYRLPSRHYRNHQDHSSEHVGVKISSYPSGLRAGKRPDPSLAYQTPDSRPWRYREPAFFGSITEYVYG